MELTIPVYQRRVSADLEWTTLGLAPHGVIHRGLSWVKLERTVVEEIRGALELISPAELARFEMPRGMYLVRPRLELSLGAGGARKRLTGVFPIVIEPRRTAAGHVSLVAYHPAAQDAWWCFEKDQEPELASLASARLSAAWVHADPEDVLALRSDGKDLLRAVRFSIRPRSLLDELPDGPTGVWDDLRAGPFGANRRERPAPPDVLRHIGTNLTLRAVDGTLPLGMPRRELRDRLTRLLASDGAGKTRVADDEGNDVSSRPSAEHRRESHRSRRSVLLVGPPGCGKTTLVSRWVADALDADDYPTHRNLDRVRHVWSIAGSRLIAGMSHLGQWEQRCLELVAECAAKDAVLYVEDLVAFGRIGRARDSDRSLAEVLRGPVGRGEIVIVGECTAEGLSRLEDEAPSFAALLTRLHVSETTHAETLRMLLHERRLLELSHDVEIDATALRTLLDLGASLFPAAALPGKALDLLRQLVRQPASVEQRSLLALVARGVSNDGRPRSSTPVVRTLDGSDVVELLARTTGLPRTLLAPRGEQDPALLASAVERRVLGQPDATKAAVDLLLRVRAGLVDPNRPQAAYLLAGPTGTGKTELARVLAEALYGDEQRLLRFDMAEHATADAVARLIGDSWRPEGSLTRAVREQPFAVVLLDEIDKAHPAVLNLLLQLLDEGRLGDASGHVADFRHTVIVMTSNLGARTSPPIGFDPTDQGVGEALRAVQDYLAPELFNRIDRVVAFGALSKESARRVAQKELSNLLRRRGLADRRVFASATDGLLDLAVERGFDARGGARTVKRWLEDHVATPLAERVAARPIAALAWVRIHRKAEQVALRYDALVEQPSPSEPSSLEDVVDLPLAELRVVAARAHAELDRAFSPEQLSRLRDRATELFERARSGDADAASSLHAGEELRDVLSATRAVLSNRKAGHDELLRAVAASRFLPRIVARIDDPTAHAVRIELLRIGSAARPRARVGAAQDGLIEWLLRAYVERGSLVAFAGRVGRAGSSTVRRGKNRAGLESLLLAGTDHVVVDLDGLGVGWLLATEGGCHLWQSLAGGAEVVRVAVRPAVAGGESPEAVLDAHVSRLRTFESALESAHEEIPEDPSALVPATRRLRFDLPREGPFEIELEDYALAHVASLRVSSVSAAIERALLLRMGRPA